MPGAPNRPPEADPKPPTAPLPADEAARKTLRRLAPSRVALKLDLWKGAPSPDLLGPFEAAEAKFGEGDFANAQGELDRLSVRFAEPRWPTLPLPFRELRVAIPAPMPPQWDPDHTKTPAERDAIKLRKFADLQVQLTEATLTWAKTHSIGLDEFADVPAIARDALVAEGPSPGFWEPIDRFWMAVRERVPAPTRGAPRVAAPPPAPTPAPTDPSAGTA